MVNCFLLFFKIFTSAECPFHETTPKHDNRVTADGYNRSEACIVMLLQRASEAKRSYGTLLGVKSMQFGDHRGHITEHAGTHFKSLLLDAYREADVDPATVDFVEAYGCGIKVMYRLGYARYIQSCA